MITHTQAKSLCLTIKNKNVMCIVIVKKTGVKFPSYKNVENSCQNNPDGFSMVWAIEGVLTNYRTMNKKEFLAKYKEISKLDFKKTALIIHARIATHGSLRVENTHCWIERSVGIAFAHNGILSVKNRGDMTDSETFFRDIFIPIYRTYGWDSATLAINACIGTSKFAFVNTSGDIKVFGQFNELNGVLYSNTSYLERTYYPATYNSSSTYSRSYDSGRYTDGYYDPEKRRMVYREKWESDATWKAKKNWVLNNYYFDFLGKTWKKRGAETDAEWKAKIEENQKVKEEYYQHIYSRWD